MAETTTPNTSQSYKDWEKAKAETSTALTNWNNKKNELITLEADYSARINLYNTGEVLVCGKKPGGYDPPRSFTIHRGTGLDCASNLANLEKEVKNYEDNRAMIAIIEPKLDGMRLEIPALKKAYEEALEAERIAYAAYLSDKSSNLTPDEISAYNAAANQGELAKAKSQQMLYWGIGIAAVLLLFVAGYFLFKYLKVKPVIPVA